MRSTQQFAESQLISVSCDVKHIDSNREHTCLSGGFRDFTSYMLVLYLLDINEYHKHLSAQESLSCASFILRDPCIRYLVTSPFTISKPYRFRD